MFISSKFGYSPFFTVAFYRLFQVKLGQVIAPQGQAIGPAGLEPLAGARNRRKVTLKNTTNRPLRIVATKGTIPENVFVHFLRKLLHVQGPINQSEVKLYKIIKQNIKIAKDRYLNGNNLNIPVIQRVHLSSGIKGTLIVKIIYNHISFSLNNFMLPKI